MQVDLDGLNDVIRPIIRDALGMGANAVRPANQNAPTGDPGEEFATVLLAVTGSPDFATKKYENEDLSSTDVREKLLQVLEVTANVQFFRGDAYSKAVRLGMLLQSSLNRQKLQRMNIGLMKISQAQDLTSVINTFYESRGLVTLSFSVLGMQIVSTPTYNQFRFEISTEEETTIFTEVTTP